MATIQSFDELPVWDTARKLINLVYDLSDHDPFARDFALKDQIRRAVISIGSNIAEGFESSSNSEFVRYLGYAKASTAEVRAQLFIASDRKYINDPEFAKAMQIATSCGAQLTGFIRYLQSHPNVRRVREDQVEYESAPE